MQTRLHGMRVFFIVRVSKLLLLELSLELLLLLASKEDSLDELPDVTSAKPASGCPTREHCTASSPGGFYQQKLHWQKAADAQRRICSNLCKVISQNLQIFFKGHGLSSSLDFSSKKGHQLWEKCTDFPSTSSTSIIASCKTPTFVALIAAGALEELYRTVPHRHLLPARTERSTPQQA